MTDTAKNILIKDGVATINLFEEINEYMSPRFAEFMDYCQSEDAIQRIEVRINSSGGYVIHGFSIVSAILNSTKPVRTINEGIAASIAAVIFLAGGERWMRDYAKVMIHDPSLWGKTIEDMSEGKDKKMLMALRDSIAQIITSQTGMNLPTVRKEMNAETWFTADECKEKGMIEKIITTKRKVNLPENSMDALMMATNLLTNNNYNMIREFFNLPEDASEEMILEAVKNLQEKAVSGDAKVSELEAKVSAYETQVTESENKLKGLQADLDTQKSELENLKIEHTAAIEAKNAEIIKAQDELNAAKNDLQAAKNEMEKLGGAVAEQEVEAAIKAGKFLDNDREALVATAKNDIEMFRKIAASVRPSIPKISQATNSALTESRNDWGYDKWSKEDPEGLKKMQAENPVKFQKLLDNYLK